MREDDEDGQWGEMKAYGSDFLTRSFVNSQKCKNVNLPAFGIKLRNTNVFNHLRTPLPIEDKQSK